jgi:muconate cycloisomerase
MPAATAECTRVAGFELFAVDLPFRNPFKHDAAERRSSYSLILRCTTDRGHVGYGECLPRPYVTGETRESAFEMLRDRILPALVGLDFEAIEDTIGFLDDCDGKAPSDCVPEDEPQCAAWCAVDLALLDTFGRAFDVPIRLTSGPTRDFRYSVVLSADSGWKSVKTMLKTRAFGIRQVKLKVEKGREAAGARLARRVLGRGCDIRADANMAWSVDEALVAMSEMARYGVRSHEQPIAADDLDGLARLVSETDFDVMADESLNDRASLETLIERKACTAVNVRISKCGGLVAAQKRCREAAEAGLKIQIGCQVGESSLLSAAHLVLASAVDEARYLEGCFGHLLLREDAFEPVLQFGYAGRPPAMPEGPGFGVSANDEILRRYTVDSATIA